MWYMEVQLLSKQSLRIKGKHAAFVINPQEKTNYNAAIMLGISLESAKLNEEAVIIQGPGEYEIGGIKMTGIQADSEEVYSLIVDGIDILVGKINTLEKMQHKVKDHNIVIVVCDETASASFVTSLANNVILFYGDKSAEVAKSFGKENTNTMTKYAVTVDKLPAEVETVLLA